MRTIHLFYDGYDLRAADGAIRAYFERARFFARKIWRTAKGQQVHTGFYVAFSSLVKSLLASGCRVTVNDFKAARRSPDDIIGIAGFPSVIQKVSELSNIKVFGPGDPGLPLEAEVRAKAHGIARILQPSEWAANLYRPVCGERIAVWPAAVDADALVPSPKSFRSLDVLVYDKIYRRYDERKSQVLDPLFEMLRARGLKFHVIRYGSHTQSAFFKLVRSAKSMAFICEHETQGLACEEVMALDVPVFAWDEGVLSDPEQRALAPPNLKVSSVPYWDERCGERFTVATMHKQFETFWNRLSDYCPRSYVEEALNLRRCGEQYLKILESVEEVERPRQEQLRNSSISPR